MGTIRYDKTSGKLLKDRIWALRGYEGSAGRYVYALLAEMWRSEDLHDCPLDKRHVTGVRIPEVRLALYGGTRLGDFIPEMNSGLLIVSESFAQRLKQSKLTGFSCLPIVTVEDNQSSVRHPKLFYLDLTGQGGCSRRLQVRGAPNRCPFCGQEPVVCPGCGRIQRDCLSCGQLTLYLPKAKMGSREKGFRLDGYPPNVDIVEAKEWDGSDGFQSGGADYISDRAKNWLEETHTSLVQIAPALLNVEGVEEKFGAR